MQNSRWCRLDFVKIKEPLHDAVGKLLTYLEAGHNWTASTSQGLLTASRNIIFFVVGYLSSPVSSLLPAKQVRGCR